MGRTRSLLIAVFAVIISLHEPLTLPGKIVLPPGNYVVKRLNTVLPIVQILDESETKVLATVFAQDIPAKIDRHVRPANVMVRTDRAGASTNARNSSGTGTAAPYRIEE
jgi:hypothetical protein